MVTIKKLNKEEVDLIRKIDRSETIKGVYTYKAGEIHLEDVHQENSGFPEEEIQKIVHSVTHLLKEEGKLYGAFSNDEFLGMAALGVTPVGKLRDKLPLEILYTTKESRGRGVGSSLMEAVIDDVKELGFNKLYISATPTINTVNFYRSKGAVITQDPDPILLEKEADDIHLELVVDIQDHNKIEGER